MPAVGGPIESISIDGRGFAVAADADTNRDIGGDNNEIQANGNKTARIVKTAMPWKVDGLSLSVDDFLGDHEFLQDIADSDAFHVIKIIYPSGAAWQGSGTITGELKYASANTTMPIEFSGEGNLTQQ